LNVAESKGWDKIPLAWNRERSRWSGAPRRVADFRKKSFSILHPKRGFPKRKSSERQKIEVKRLLGAANDNKEGGQ
jgi:hypothetical protein